MDNVNINDPKFQSTALYQNFMRNNPGKGSLLIRAFGANEAFPIVGLKIRVTSLIENVMVTFYEGETDISGMIPKLGLPAPIVDENDLKVPASIIYNINATYSTSNSTTVYNVNLYDRVCVVQNISYIPELNQVGGPSYGR